MQPINGSVVQRLYDLIVSRRGVDPERSYVARLFQKGRPKMAQKVGEEAVEVSIAAMQHDHDHIVSESAGSVALTFRTDTAVPSGQTVTVNFQIAAGSATPAQDYQAAGLAFANGVYSGSVQIAGGATTATVPVSILGDTAVEGNETFAVNITSVSGAGATLADGGAVDANLFCRTRANLDFGCRSTGGGRDNRQVCIPGGTAPDAAVP